MLSVCNENFAFYDKENDRVVYQYNQGKRTIPLGGKTLSSVCVTDDSIHFILDNKYVRGDFEEGVFRSVDSLPSEGKKWVKIFYTKKENFKILTLLSHNEDAGYHEFFIEDDDGNWLDISPRDNNTVQSIPEFDFESRMTYFVCNLTKYYYGVFDPVSKAVVWKHVQMPPDLNFSRVALGKHDIFFTTFDHVSGAIRLYNSCVDRLRKDEQDATKMLFENYAIILNIHSYRDITVFLCPDMIILSRDGKLYSIEFNKLEDGDYMLEMQGLNDDLIFRSNKGDIFKGRLQDDMYLEMNKVN